MTFQMAEAAVLREWLAAIVDRIQRFCVPPPLGQGGGSHEARDSLDPAREGVWCYVETAWVYRLGVGTGEIGTFRQPNRRVHGGIRDARLEREAPCGRMTTEVRVNGESRLMSIKLQSPCDRERCGKRL